MSDEHSSLSLGRDIKALLRDADNFKTWNTTRGLLLIRSLAAAVRGGAGGNGPAHAGCALTVVDAFTSGWDSGFAANDEWATSHPDFAQSLSDFLATIEARDR